MKTLRLLLLLLVVLVCMTSSSHSQTADSLAGKTIERPSRAADTVSRVALYGGTVADLLTTRWVLSHGGYEANPFAPTTLNGQIAISAVYAGGIDALATAARRDGHPKIATYARWIFGGLKIGLAVHNGRVARHQIARGR